MQCTYNATVVGTQREIDTMMVELLRAIDWQTRMQKRNKPDENNHTIAIKIEITDKQ